MIITAAECIVFSICVLPNYKPRVLETGGRGSFVSQYRVMGHLIVLYEGIN